MKYPHLGLLCALAFIALALIPKARATTFPFEYDWSGHGGFSGKIFFDSSSNSNGSLSDVDVANSFVTTPDGTFVFNAGNIGPSLLGILSWNPSEITAMDILGGFVSPFEEGGYEASQNSISDFFFDSGPVVSQDNGSWLAHGSQTVPETGNSISLFAAALILLGGVFRLSQSRRQLRA